MPLVGALWGDARTPVPCDITATLSVQDGAQQARLARLLSKYLLRLGEEEPSTLLEVVSEAEAFCVRVSAQLVAWTEWTALWHWG